MEGIDIALIALAKRSPAYRAIRPRVADPCPSDAWRDGGLAYLAFDLLSTGGEPWTPQAVFVLAASGEIVAARLVESDGTAGGARIIDLLAQVCT